MKRLNVFLAILLAFILTLSVAACAGNGEESSSSSSSSSEGEVETPPTVWGPEEGWVGNWTRPDIPSGGGSTGANECTHKCSVCGKCVDIDPENDADTCTEKCYDQGDRTLYVFNATDKRVDRQGGVKIEGDYVGGINNNPHVVITFKIKAEEDTTVCLGATISEMNEDKYVTSMTPIYVNDAKVFSRACLKGGSGAWTNFKTVWLGCVNLRKGENTIQFTNVNNGGQQYNFKDFSFLSPVKLDWTTELVEHICQHKDANGKCTDYDCNKYECLDKPEDGWKTLKIDAGDEKVLKYAGNDTNLYGLWNSGEGCIGNIANSLVTGIYDQTIIFSFTATEDTYIRLSLNTSTNSQNVAFTEMYSLTIDGVLIETEGRSGSAESGAGWHTYVDGTIAYVKVSGGTTHTFMMVHKAVNMGDNIKYLTIHYQNGVLTAAQAQKPQS